MTTNLETIEPIEQQGQSGGAAVRTLESRALKGTYLMVTWYGLAMCLRLLSSVVLTRLFVPSDFGLMSLMTTVLVGMTLFSHVGLEDSVIQNPRGDDPPFLNTAWTIQVIRGVGLTLLTLPIALPVARFYHEPQIVALLPALGLSCLIAGFSSPGLLTLSRHLGIGKLSGLELFSQLIQFALTAIWAWIHPTIWALVFGKLVAELTRTLVSYWMVPEIRPRFVWEKAAVRSLVKFGRWILIGTALTFLALQSDRLILAKLVSFQVLGVYGIAFTLSDIPRQIIMQFCSRIGFPFLAKFAHQPRWEFRAVLLKYRSLVLILGGILIIAVTLTGDIFIRHVYTRPYYDASWMIGILAVGLWHTMLYSTVSPAVLSLAKAHYNAFAYLAYCITLYVAMPVAFHLLGLLGAVIAVAASDLPVYFITAYAARREGVSTWRQDALLTVAFVCVLGLALGGRAWMGFGSPFSGLH